MAVRKNKPTTEEPRREKEVSSTDRAEKSLAGRRRPPEPFEECGPSGGYGGAGTEEERKDDN